jgi:hypothetical protein
MNSTIHTDPTTGVQYTWDGTQWQPLATQPPPKKRHTARTVAIVAGALIVVGGVAGALGSGSEKKAATPVTHSATASAPSTTAPAVQPPIVEEPAASYITPTKADFAIKLKILSKECFGSAGCVISYRPQLVENFVNGSTDPSVTYDVSYTVSGGQDGPISDTIYATGDQYEQPMDGTAQTVSSGVKLTAKVTAVEAE